MHMTHTASNLPYVSNPVASRVVERAATVAASVDSRSRETVARLAREFAGKFSAHGVEIVLEGCIADLSGVSSAAIPELSERLARQRITSYCRSKDREFR